MSREPNEATYHRDEVVDFYVAYADIQPPERAFVDRYVEELRTGRVLDIGVGGGRTTVVLEPLSGSYVGIDYAAPLVEAARRRCPGVDLRVMDARDLHPFGDAAFDLVVFSFNGIDYVDHPGRLLALAEIHRVLSTDGLLFFSTHNRDIARLHRFPWPTRVRPTRRWLGEAKRASVSYRRHIGMRRQASATDEYAVVNDEGHDFRLLTYYISAERQREQLAQLGFHVEDVLALDGRSAPDHDRDSVYLHYVARKGLQSGVDERGPAAGYR